MTQPPGERPTEPSTPEHREAPRPFTPGDFAARHQAQQAVPTPPQQEGPGLVVPADESGTAARSGSDDGNARAGSRDSLAGDKPSGTNAAVESDGESDGSGDELRDESDGSGDEAPEDNESDADTSGADTSGADTSDDGAPVSEVPDAVVPVGEPADAVLADPDESEAEQDEVSSPKPEAAVSLDRPAREQTGDERVDEALSSLDAADGQPIDAHIAAATQVHHTLQQRLSDLHD